jgi:subtilisin family serine protease
VEPNYRFRDPESVRRRYPVIDRSPRGSKYTIQRAVTQTNLAAALAISDGAGTVIAIMDSGVDPCQPFLRGHLMSGGLDLVDGDLSPWEVWNGVDEDDDGDLDEAFGHGTFVATIVALAAPAARILPYRVLDSDGGGTAFDIALALADAIDRRVDVINLSLTYHHRSMVVDLLLEEASNRSIVIVAAAGNDGEEHLPFPASDGHVLAVAALGADGQGLADFSNRGDQVTLAAPGEDVYGGLAGGDFGTVSGTSVAAPFAAAGAALLKSLDPAVSPDIVRRLLVESGVPLVVDQGAANGLDLEEAVSRVTP